MSERKSDFAGAAKRFVGVAVGVLSAVARSNDPVVRIPFLFAMLCLAFAAMSIILRITASVISLAVFVFAAYVCARAINGFLKGK